jgi:glycosyltransferase involved in cell wall biosynthesis
MPHGVDLATYAAVPIRSDSNGPFCIGYVGRLTTEKNVRSLVDLERNLLAAGERDFKLLIVGEGGQRQWLEKHLKNVEFTGVLRDKHLIAAYSRMHALVFPSRTDTFGLVVLEAMASGVPVVLSPETGRNVGIEDGISGLLSTDFAASLRRLMHDRPLQLAMSSAARQAANGHSWHAAFEQLYRVYARELIYLASCFRENMR